MTVAVDDTTSGVVLSARVASIIDHERQADELSEQSDAHRWEAARLIAEELAEGKSQRELARELGKSHSHAGQMARTWRYFGNLGFQERPPWNEAYHSPEVRGVPQPKPELKPAVNSYSDDREAPWEPDPDFELPGRAEHPIEGLSKSPAEYLADNMASFLDLLKFCASLLGDEPAGKREQLRNKLHEMIDEVIR